MKTLKVRIKGFRPLIFTNPQTVKLSNYYAVVSRKLNAELKAARKKGNEDKLLEIEGKQIRNDWEASAYWSKEDKSFYLPDTIIAATIRAGAAAAKKGQAKTILRSGMSADAAMLQEVVDNIVDYGHLSPIHGSTVERYENAFKGHNALQRQCGGHRTLVGSDPANSTLYTDTVYHGPGVLISHLTGLYDAVMMITHTPVDDGTIKVWHALLVKSPGGNATSTRPYTVAARQFQQAALTAFAQDFGVWTNKGLCLNGLFIPSDGPFMKARIWYKQFYNPRAMKQEFLDQCEGYYVPKGAVP